MLNLDTHILIFALTGDLTNKEKKLLSNNSWSICPIVLWELYKLEQLGRIEFLGNPDIRSKLSTLHLWPIDFLVFRSLSKLDFKNDPADELIAATSIAYQVPLVTRDKNIRRSKITPLA